MIKIITVANILQWALVLLLITAVAGFLSFVNVYGFFLASITTLIAWGTYENKRWAYFAAASWGLACFQLAKQGYEFQGIKHQVMAIGVLIIPVSLFLHEILGKQQNINAQKSVTNVINEDDLPQ